MKASELTRLPETYDALYHRYGDAAGFPLSLLRTLSYYETKNRADQKPIVPGGTHAGLFQIGKAERTEYNLANGTHYTQDDIYNPAVSTQIAVWLLHRIIATYHSAAPDVLAPAWEDPAYVSIVILGWTAGWSPKEGVASIVAAMRAAGVPRAKIGLASVIQMAQVRVPRSRIYVKGGGVGPYMSDPILKTWVTKATGAYMADLLGRGGWADPRRPVSPANAAAVAAAAPPLAERLAATTAQTAAAHVAPSGWTKLLLGGLLVAGLGYGAYRAGRDALHPLIGEMKA